MRKRLPLETAPARKPRSDAQRNRQRILAAAQEVFTRDGAAAMVDEIAKRAGVGNATLYRHFPTRDDLLAAVYKTEVEKLAAAEQILAATLPPVQALRAWMLQLIDCASRRSLILPALDTVPGGSVQLAEGSRPLIREAFLTSIQRAIKSGDLRSDINPNDIVRGLIGILHTTDMPGWEVSARRLVDILIDGSRPRRRFLDD